MDATNYELLMQTQKQADAESEAAKARIEEAKKREELRQQQLVELADREETAAAAKGRPVHLGGPAEAGLAHVG